MRTCRFRAHPSGPGPFSQPSERKEFFSSPPEWVDSPSAVLGKAFALSRKSFSSTGTPFIPRDLTPDRNRFSPVQLAAWPRLVPVRTAAVFLSALLLPLAAQASTLARDRDPVVMAGLDLPSFSGVPVDRIAAFRYQGGWIQIPVQVDERDLVDARVVHNYPEYPIEFSTLAYTDSTTYTGPDSDPLFDGDDELVFMAADAGDRVADARDLPAGLVAGSGLEVAISDPLDGGAGHVYLFETDGSVDPGAGASYGTYSFHLLAGSYIPNYDTMDGPNPEDSAFVSPLYRTHFSDRWIRDELEVTTPGSTGVDVLDRHKNLFGPGVCTRTEDTFSAGEGAFFANKSGPVRSIRSYLGANSGPLTQRDHLFYAGRQDITTFLRVHAIPSLMDLFDYSPAATGMTYRSDLDPQGVVVDGVPDAVSPGDIRWEMVTGGQGSVIVAHSVETDIPALAYTSYYSDDTTPGVRQCTGDAFEYATSGLWIDAGIPNTDPSQGAYQVLRSTRVVYYDPPGQTVADAEHRFEQATTPLAIATAPLPEPACSNGIDDDGDDFTDYPNDPGCRDAASNLENAACQDGEDNDGDGRVDSDGGLSILGTGDPRITDPDPECLNSYRNSEAQSRGCGLGLELTLPLSLLAWMRRRRR